jgi:predicted transcriptional regulator YdeE
MPKFNISKSIHIKASTEKVFNTLNDFNSWIEWSPWLIMDRDTKVNIASDNKSYEWKGKRTGIGNMKILKEVPFEKITYDLNFMKPWKSHAKVNFEVKEEGDGTLVTWIMDSSLPFFMFFMKKMMSAFVGNDYERGLNLLKDYVEDGEIHSQLNFIGQQNHNGHDFLGIKRTCSLEDAPTNMSTDIAKVAEYGRPDGIFVQYHKWDFVKKICSYTAGISVEQIPDDLPADLTTGRIPDTRIYTLEHVGPYRHLGNAWTTMYNMQRGKEFKIKKDIHPFETYGNDPATTPENELITHINFAIK